MTTITNTNRAAIVGVNWNDPSVKGEVNREMAAAALARRCRGLLHRAQPLHRVRITDTEISTYLEFFASAGLKPLVKASCVYTAPSSFLVYT